MHNDFLKRLQIRWPIFQAPMAGVSTPSMAAAVSNAGGLGALGLGASTPDAAAQAIEQTKALTRAPFNVNVFCHAPAERNAAVERAWIERARPLFETYGASPPSALKEIYTSFRASDAMLDVIVGLRPPVVSFHFGLPTSAQLDALRGAGLILMASATSLAEARTIEQAGLDAVIAQGWEAGGHRGLFDPGGEDERLATQALTRLLAQNVSLPVIAAGGLMDGHDVRAALGWGAVAGQLGTAFVACPESAADAGYRQRMAETAETVMTPVLSGRPARCLANAFTRWGADIDAGDIPAYPCAYDLAKALNGSAKAQGETGFGAQWAGQGAARSRALPAADLMTVLAEELEADR